MAKKNPHEPLMFMHSACCNAHWELVLLDNQQAELQCEACGKPAGPQVKVSVNVKPECDHCKALGLYDIDWHKKETPPTD